MAVPTGFEPELPA